MAGWKRLECLSSVKEIESIDVVVDERRDPRPPRVGPRPTEYELELVLYDDGSQGADCADGDGRLEFRKSAPHDGNEPIYDEHDCRHPRNREDPIDYMRRCGMFPKDFVDPQRDRFVKPLKRKRYESRGQDKADKPNFENACHFALTRQR